MRLADCRLAIIGLGLMGGSLAAGLAGRCRWIVGADRDPGAVELALARGWIQSGFTDPAAALRDCDLAVLALPVRAILALLGRLGSDLPLPPRLLDLGSTKSEVLAAMAALPAGVAAVGGHPLCGRETSGLAAADAGLFHGCRFAVIPVPACDPEAVALVEELVMELGAQPLRVGARRHDRLTALTSHTPYLLAVALAIRARRLEKAGEPIAEAAASGFHSAVRLAGSEPTMMLDILLTNRANVLRELEEVQSELAALSHLLARGEEAELGERLRAGREARGQWAASQELPGS